VINRDRKREKRRTGAHGRRDDILDYPAWPVADHLWTTRYGAERLGHLTSDERPSSGDEWGVGIATIAKSRRPVAERM